MLIKMAIERAKLIQFECEVQVSTNLPTKRQEFILPQKVTDATFELYFSAIGEYWIQISKYTNPYSNESEVFYRGILENAKVLGFIQHSKWTRFQSSQVICRPSFESRNCMIFVLLDLVFQATISRAGDSKVLKPRCSMFAQSTVNWTMESSASSGMSEMSSISILREVLADLREDGKLGYGT